MSDSGYYKCPICGMNTYSPYHPDNCGKKENK